MMSGLRYSGGKAETAERRQVEGSRTWSISDKDSSRSFGVVI